MFGNKTKCFPRQYMEGRSLEIKKKKVFRSKKNGDMDGAITLKHRKLALQTFSKLRQGMRLNMG